MTLRVGDRAPDFRLRDQHGRPTALNSFRGEKVVVIAFFPFVFSGVCTSELRELRNHAPRIKASDAEVLAISCDPMYSLRAYADQDHVEFPMLSDFWPHGDVARAYDAFVPDQGCATRTTFVVDRDGLLRWTLHNPMGEARRISDVMLAVEDLHPPDTA